MKTSIRSAAYLAFTATLLTYFAGAALALPAGYSEITVNTGVPNGAMAFAPDGTLYIAQSYTNFGTDTMNTIEVINPNGTLGSPINVTGINWGSPNSLAWDSVGNRLLLTDNVSFANGKVDAINPSTGAGSTLVSGITAVDHIAIRSTGQILVSSSGGPGAGTIYQLNRATNTIASVVTGLTYPGSMTFSSAGDLYLLDGVSYPDGSFYKVPITGSGTLSFGSPTLLQTVTNASLGLIADSSDDFFATGTANFTTGQLMRIDHSNLASSTLFDTSIDPFISDIQYRPGTSAFAPNVGPAAGQIAFLTLTSNNPSSTVTLISSVPEPSSMVLLLSAAGGLLLLRRVRPAKSVR